MIDNSLAHSGPVNMTKTAVVDIVKKQQPYSPNSLGRPLANTNILLDRPAALQIWSYPDLLGSNGTTRAT